MWRSRAANFTQDAKTLSKVSGVQAGIGQPWPPYPCLHTLDSSNPDCLDSAPWEIKFPITELTRKKERLRTIRDLDNAALQHLDACSVILEEPSRNVELATIFSRVARDELEAASGQAAKVQSAANGHIAVVKCDRLVPGVALRSLICWSI